MSGFTVHNVKDFGAKGDGGDDAAAIQSAVNAANAAGGGVVYFPPGTYCCGKQATYNDPDGLGIGSHDYAIAIPTGFNNAAPKIGFVGAGHGASTIQKLPSSSANTDYNLFLAPARVGQQSAYVSFRDLTLDGDGTNFTAGDEHLILAPAMNYFTVAGVRFTNARGGGLYLWYGYYGRLLDCQFENLDLAGAQNAITLVGGVDFGFPPPPNSLTEAVHLVRGCTFVNCRQMGIAIGGFFAQRMIRNVSISDCKFIVDVATAPDGQGIEIVNVTGVQDVTISDCHFIGGEGITLQGTNIAVHGCHFFMMNRGGGVGHAIECPNGPETTRVLLQGDIVDTATNAAFQLDGTDITAIGNKITGAPVGILVSASATRARLHDNDLAGNTTAITDSATGTTRRGNRLSTGAMKGQAVLVAGTATVSTAEVQAGDSIILSRVASGGTRGHLSVGGISAGSSFVINSSSGTDTSTIYWEIVH